MRIAYLCADRGIALGGFKGASVHVAEVVSALARRGAEILLLPSSIAAEPRLPAGVTVEPLPPTRNDARLAEWLSARLRSFEADVLYERFALNTAAGATAVRRLGIPHVVELNAPLPLEAARYRTLDRPMRAHRLERSVLAGADLVLAVSGPVAHYAQQRGAARVDVLSNGVDVRRFAGVSCTQEPRCVFLGTLRPWHGTSTIAAAWRLFDGGAPPLLVVGDGAGRRELEAVGADVTGVVRHAEVPSLLATASIGLAPYAVDAPDYFSPLKLFEYLAAGLAVVAGGIAGVREVVGPDHAVLIPPGNPEALAAAVAELVRDGAKRSRLGAAGRELVATRHSWDARAQRILGLVPEPSLAVAS